MAPTSEVLLDAIGDVVGDLLMGRKLVAASIYLLLFPRQISKKNKTNLYCFSRVIVYYASYG